MTALIASLRDRGAITAIDAELVRMLADLAGEHDESVLLGAALASRATRDGHVCADLARLAERPVTGEDGEEIPGLRLPPLEAWTKSLAASSLVGDGTGCAPLVLDERGRLYLARYFEDERRLARALRSISSERLDPASPQHLAKLVARLFGESPADDVDMQRFAVEVSAVSRLTVITGGPGTGKTTTVAKILAVAISDSLAWGKRRPRALLLAPTGKAAARLAEATARIKTTLDCTSDVVSLIPETAQTLHRALGASRPGRPFRVDAERPLFADIVVVDEASMVDVTMMRRLVEAVPKSARLVLLGDHRQLSSVEAAAVLADICGDAVAPRYSKDLAERIARTFAEPLPPHFIAAERPPGMSDAIVALTRSYRFGKTTAIGGLADAVAHGDSEAALDLLTSRSDALVLLEPASDGALHPGLASELVAGFGPLASAASPEAALSRAEGFRVLSAARRGPLGVVDLNTKIERLLLDRGLLGKCPGSSRLVLVTKNDAGVGLYNGDVGVSFRESAEAPSRTYFTKPGSSALRALSLARLPAHEPAFAMSVHKSQGSEFDSAVVVLPPVGSPLLVRELLYTAVTRARRKLVVHASRASIRQAVERRMVRASGLWDALYGSKPP